MADTTTSTSTTTVYVPGIIVTTIKRKPVSLNDPDYFCNRSWTLSFNMNTRSWVSFHSYVPNWYMGDNRFFYSGSNDCCEDFDFVAGVLTPDPSTTTTTTLYTTTTTTTGVPLDCELSGHTDTKGCYLEGNAIDFNADPVICKRPLGLEQFFLVTGYGTVDPAVVTVSTGSSYSACQAHYYIEENFADANVYITYIGMEAEAIAVGNQAFELNGGDDCACVPDGWYFTEELSLQDKVFHVVDCFIVEIVVCTTGMTSTSTTTSTSTSTTSTTQVPTTTTTTTIEPTTTTTTTIEPTTTTTTTTEFVSTTTTTTTVEPTTTTTTTTVEPTTTTTTTTVEPTTTTTTTTVEPTTTTTTTTVEPTTTTTTTTVEPTTTTTTTTVVPTTTSTTTVEPTSTTTSTTTAVPTTTSTTTSSTTTTTTTVAVCLDCAPYFGTL